VTQYKYNIELFNIAIYLEPRLPELCLRGMAGRRPCRCRPPGQAILDIMA
jgi:hypothetical protein